VKYSNDDDDITLRHKEPDISLRTCYRAINQCKHPQVLRRNWKGKYFRHLFAEEGVMNLFYTSSHCVEASWRGFLLLAVQQNFLADYFFKAHREPER